MKKRFFDLRKMSCTRLIAGGYALIICIGTLLLMLPAASADGVGAPPLQAFFTAVSATCVTGLVVADTATAWSVFGQAVILTLIQIGGLGFMSFFALFSIVSGKRMTLRARGLLRDSVNAAKLGGVQKLFRVVLLGTLVIEAVGAVLLLFAFVPQFGAKGIWMAVFHSVSAFCNAGFDILGTHFGAYASVTGYHNNPFVLLTLCVLILLGGLGFFVWQDIYENRLNFRRYSLHAKIALTASTALVLGGFVLFFICEKDASMQDMHIGQKLINALFCSVSPRTAGMNSVDFAKMSPAGILLTDILMLIGGNPGSTAGGIKTVTVAVLLISARANLTNTGSRNVFGRRLPDETIKKALTVVLVYVGIILVSLFALLCMQPEVSLSDGLFTVISAIATVGLSTVTLGEVMLPASQVLLAALMFCGRVGSMSFVLLFTEKKMPSAVVKPEEDVLVG
ncbi:MAG: Trk family potassium uptake protein [Ruminococcaceae bacterium]|nr:Trk family potassium uptake protein [Oscillospiraceae bacterium]